MIYRKMRIALVAASLAALATGAVSTQVEGRTEARSDSFTTWTASEATTLYVKNRNSQDVVVYAITETGKRHAIGTVNGLRDRKFTIPASLVNGGVDFRLAVYGLGIEGPYNYLRKIHRGVKTNPIQVTPGGTIELLVGQPLGLTSVSVAGR